MNYYKVLLKSTGDDGTETMQVVDAQAGPLCVRYNERRGIMLYCPIEEAQGIVDSFGQGTYWHVDGWPEFPESAGVTETVYLEVIEEEEDYRIIRDALAAGQPVPDPIPEPEPEPPSDDELEVVRTGALAKMSTACNAAIVAGVDVVLADGMPHHFSLTVEDQINLVSLQSLIVAGQTQVPYHADGEECRYFTVEEFNAVTQAATLWKTYHESYYNSLRSYINAMTDIKSIGAIEYGVVIPEEYQTAVLQELTALLVRQGAMIG